MPKAAIGVQVAKAKTTTKLQTIVQLLQRPDGAALDELVSATSWQKHSVRGAISGALKKKHGLLVSSTVAEGRGRIYRIEKQASEDGKLVASSGDNAGEVQS